MSEPDIIKQSLNEAIDTAVKRFFLKALLKVLLKAKSWI